MKHLFKILIITLNVFIIQNGAYSQKPTLVSEIYPGPRGSNPSVYLEYNHKLYFSAKCDDLNMEMWEYNELGPPIMYDLNKGEYGSFPRDFCVFNNTLFFNAKDGIHGRELWAFDGQNFPEIKFDIYPGQIGSNPLNLIVFNDALYFRASHSIYGIGLWKYNGITPPEIVYDYILPQYLCIFNDNLFFSASHTLWYYDGINNPQVVSDSISNIDPAYLIVYNNKLYFNAYDDENGYELWVYDGVNQPTLAFDIYSGGSYYYDPYSQQYYYFPYSSDPRNFTVYNNKLYFNATDSIHGKELWVLDGANSPNLVYDFNPGVNSSYIYTLSEYNDKLFFGANDGTHGKKLWEYDGVNNPKMVYDSINGTDCNSPEGYQIFNNKLYFRATDSIYPYNFELWVYDEITTTTDPIITNKQQIMVFPNPSKDKIFIQIENQLINSVLIDIINSTGKLIYSKHYILTKNLLELNISNYPKDIYIINIKGDDFSFVKKFVKI